MRCSDRLTRLTEFRPLPHNPLLCRIQRSFEGVLTFCKAVGGEIEKRFLNSRELARYLGLCEPTVRDWVRLKKVPFYKLGKAVRFDLREIEKWLESKRIKPVENNG